MRLPKFTSPVILVLFILTSLWLALVVTSPLMVPKDTLRDLSGVVGLHDNDAQFAGLSPLPHAIYWIGDGECHQIASRSYFLNGNQLPFCSRDLGIFLGLASGFGLVAFRKIKIKPWLALAGLAPIAIDGGLQLVTSYESTNPLRLATGILAGVALALLMAHFVFVFKEDKPKPTPVTVPPTTEARPQETS